MIFYVTYFNLSLWLSFCSAKLQIHDDNWDEICDHDDYDYHLLNSKNFLAPCSLVKYFIHWKDIRSTWQRQFLEPSNIIILGFIYCWTILWILFRGRIHRLHIFLMRVKYMSYDYINDSISKVKYYDSIQINFNFTYIRSFEWFRSYLVYMHHQHIPNIDVSKVLLLYYSY